MKKRVYWVAIVALSAILSSCGVALQSAAYYDDMYGVHDRTEIASRQKAALEAQQAQQAQYDAMVAQIKAGGTVAPQANSYSSVLADSYESAYARRLYGFSSPTYRMPSSYSDYRYTDAFHYASAYDPAYYNVMVSGDQVWVEPKYITSMFGTWGATPVPSYGWYYGWSSPYSASWWSPYHSWFDVYWGMGIYGMYGWYDPFWGWGYPYPPFYYGPYPGPHPGGAPHHPHNNIVHRNPGATPPSSRGGSYGAPSQRGGGTVRPTGSYGRPSAPSSGRNDAAVRPSGGTTRPSSSSTTYRNSGSYNSSPRSNSGSFTGGGHSGGFTGGGHSGGFSGGNSRGR